MSEETQNKYNRTSKSAVSKSDFSKENPHRKSKNERKKHQRSCSRSYSRSRSRSPKDKSSKKSEVNYDIPDRSLGDLFCRACQCHMNGDHMWEAHIQGKRHIKNTKSGSPVDMKYEYLDEDPIIKPEIDADTRLIIGLEHICEIQRLEQKPIYSCFLCSSTLPNYQQLVEHILGLKHRLAYLKEHDLNQHEMIQKSQLRKCHLESIVEECIMKHAKKDGKGKMIVKRERKKTAFPFYKRSHSYDHDSHMSHSYDHGYSTSKHPRHERSSSSEWKKISSSDSKYYERERYPSEYRSDSDIDQYYSRREEIESRSAYYQTSTVKEASPPVVKSDSGSSRLWTDETPRHGISGGFESVDLRKVLEQKKSFGILTSFSSLQNNIAAPVGSTAKASSANLPPSSSITSISESMLQFINDLTPEMFFHLALFKLDNMEIQEEKIIKLLDCLIKRATDLSCDIKTNKIFPSLKAKFHESMAQNGIFPQSNSDFNHSMENFIQHYKSQKSLDRNSLPTSPSNSNYLPTNLNSMNCSSYSTGTTSTAASFDHTWNQNCTPVPFKGFSSTPLSIPGLTLTEEINSQPAKPPTQTYPPMRSPFEQLAENARHILGDLKMPLRNEYI